MKVRNFIFHDGVSAQLSNYANFTAEFVKWSSEPGVALCKISTGKMLKIPYFSLEGFNMEDHPTPEDWPNEV